MASGYPDAPRARSLEGGAYTLDRVLTNPVPLSDDVTLRPLRADDAEALTAAYARNREHLAPWDPVRDESFYTAQGQRAEVARLLAAQQAATTLPLVLATQDAVLGRATLGGITRGPFHSAGLGYWIDGEYAGRGLMTAAVTAIVTIARDELGLHRLQAETLQHNEASQRVLRRAGFERIGFAPNYLKIAGRWQDHILFQRILHD